MRRKSNRIEWNRRVEYYPTVVFLTTNKLAQAALGNWAIVMTIGLGKLMSKLFLGPLRDIEVEVRNVAVYCGMVWYGMA